MWDNPLVHTDLTLNLLFQATLNPRISAWEYFNGAFDYTATSLCPIGCKIIIHTTSNKQKSWDKRGCEGFSVGPVLHHYRCIQAIYSKTKSLIITYTAEYLHAYIMQPHVTAENIITHAIHFLSAALKDVPTSICDSQLAAIEAVRTIFANWLTVESLPPESPKVLTHPKPVVPLQTSSPLRYPVPTSKGGQSRDRVTTSKGASQQQPLTISKNTIIAANSKGDQKTISTHTISRIASANPPYFHKIQTLNEPIADRKKSITLDNKYTTLSHSLSLAAQLLMHVAYSVLDHDTGKQLNYGKRRKHPKFQETWNKYFSNEMGRLCQGVVTGENGIGERVEGTDTFYVIKFEYIPKYRLNKICYTSVVCEVRPGNKDSNRTLITICGTNICYPGDVGTNTASL